MHQQVSTWHEENSPAISAVVCKLCEVKAQAFTQPACLLSVPENSYPHSLHCLCTIFLMGGTVTSSAVRQYGAPSPFHALRSRLLCPFRRWLPLACTHILSGCNAPIQAQLWKMEARELCTQTEHCYCWGLQ